jgi:hypothetical protein
MFIGYGRSGHTLVANLLNQHPNASIGRELRLLWALWDSREQSNKARHYNLIAKRLLQMIQVQSRELEQEISFSGYQQPVFGPTDPLQKKLLVVGDKFGGNTSKFIMEFGLEEFHDMMEPTKRHALRLLHVVRNPFDMIATGVIKRIAASMGIQVDELSVKEALELLTEQYEESTLDVLIETNMNLHLDYFFSLADSVLLAKQSGTTPILDVHYSKLLENPEHTLKSILQFLGLEGDAGYYAKCASALKPEHKSRFLYPKLYPPQRVKMVGKRMQKYQWFRGYDYQN